MHNKTNISLIQVDCHEIGISFDPYGSTMTTITFNKSQKSAIGRVYNLFCKCFRQYQTEFNVISKFYSAKTRTTSSVSDVEGDNSTGGKFADFDVDGDVQAMPVDVQEQSVWLPFELLA